MKDRIPQRPVPPPLDPPGQFAGSEVVAAARRPVDVSYDPHPGPGVRARSSGRPSSARPASPVPGACEVVLVRAWHLTDAHVIRLRHGQGTWRVRPRRPRGGAIDVRHAWREVLDVFRDRDSLEAQFGEWQPACAQQGCSARLHDDGWHVLCAAGTTDGHEHKPSHRPGQLDAGLAGLAGKVWEDSAGTILIRVLIHELSDPGEIEDLFVVLDRNDLIESQSLPAAGRETAWARGPAGEFTPDMLDRLIIAAGELWDSTGGHDPYDVLSAPQREALDRAAAVHRARPGQETGSSGDLHGDAQEAAR